MKREHDDMNDDDLEALLRQVGARHEPSATTTDEVRRAVHDEWRTSVARRKRRSRAVGFAIAASIALVVFFASWMLRFAVPTPGDIAVTIARIEGASQVRDSSSDDGSYIHVGNSVPVGGVLETDDATRIALTYDGNVSLRIDRNSSIERVASDRFRLNTGAVYVDAPPQNRNGGRNEELDHALVIETIAGAVRHLGTQYQIRQSTEAVEISVREGQVELAHADGAALGSEGERLRISATGHIERGEISPRDPSWNWAEATSPPFTIEDRTLAEFLEWAARETGRTVSYASAEDRRAAEEVRLHGAIDDLDPDTALSVVLSTTEFIRYESVDQVIGVQRTKRRNSR